MARSTDAASNVFSVPYYCTLYVNMTFEDESLRTDVATDSRTTFTVKDSEYIFVDSQNTIRVNDEVMGTISNVEVIVTFSSKWIAAQGVGGDGFTASLFFHTVEMNSIVLSATPYPSYENTYEDPLFLEEIQCTGVWEKASLSVLGILSDGSEKDLSTWDINGQTTIYVASSSFVTISGTLVSANAVGRGTIYATFESFISNSLPLEVSNDKVAVNSVSIARTSSNFHAAHLSKMTLEVDITLKDGLRIWNAEDYQSWVNFSEYLSFSSDSESVVDIDSEVLTLLDNWYTGVNVTVTPTCSSGEISSLEAAGNAIFYPNLSPYSWDVDFKMDDSSSLQFAPKAVGDIFTILVIVNTESGMLVTLQMKIYYNNEHIQISNCSAYGSWATKKMVFNWQDISGQIYMAGIGGDSSTQGNASLVIAKCSFKVKTSDPVVTMFDGYVEEFGVKMGGGIEFLRNYDIHAGRGYMSLNGGTNIFETDIDFRMRPGSLRTVYEHRRLVGGNIMSRPGYRCTEIAVDFSKDYKNVSDCLTAAENHVSCATAVQYDSNSNCRCCADSPPRAKRNKNN
jgi:hypothetical protein